MDSNYITNSANDTPEKGYNMPWKLNNDGTTTLLVHLRVQKGNSTVGTHKQKTIPTQDIRKIALEYADFVSKIKSGCSLTERNTLKFSDLVEHYTKNAKNDSTVKCLKRDIGNLLIGPVFAKKFNEYIDRLTKTEFSCSWAKCETIKKMRSRATILRYKAITRAILRRAWLDGLINDLPIRGWDIGKSHGRDRVLDGSEIGKLLDTLQRVQSPIYWAVYFALRNPIRKGDLFSLTRDTLDMTVPWVRFYPQKTGERQSRPTCLINIDKPLIDYFLSLPTDCNLLFPRLGVVSGRWCPMGCIQRHWATVCRLAGIPDFRFHDLRHCATKYMLDNGHTRDELLRLKIHGTMEMVERYDSADQREVAKKSRSNTVAVIGKAVGK